MHKTNHLKTYYEKEKFYLDSIKTFFECLKINREMHGGNREDHYQKAIVSLEEIRVLSKQKYEKILGKKL